MPPPMPLPLSLPLTLTLHPTLTPTLHPIQAPMDNPKIVIVGAGPTGLCAAYRLTELGYTNWKLLEGTSEPAGLACTIKDQAG